MKALVPADPGEGARVVAHLDGAGWAERAVATHGRLVWFGQVSRKQSVLDVA